MNSLPFELLEDILNRLSARDLLQDLVVQAHTRVGDLGTILAEFPRLSSLKIEMSDQVFTHIPCDPRAKQNLINSLHRVSRQFNGHATVRHFSADSDLALAGALKCPRLVSLSVSTILTFDAMLDMDMDYSSFHLGIVPTSLLHHARNIALILVKLPALKKLHIVKPIFWRLPDSVPTEIQKLASIHAPLSSPLDTLFMSQLNDLSIDSICAWSLVNLINYIGQGKLVHLRRFVLLVDLHLPYNTMTALSAGCPELHSIEFSHTRLAPSHILDLVGLKASLTHLKFYFVQCHIPQVGSISSVYEWLLPYLASTLPLLTKIELAHTDIEILQNSHELIEPCSFSSVYRGITHLTVFDLNDETECLLKFVPHSFPNLAELKLHIGCKPSVKNHTDLLNDLINLRSLELRYRGSSAEIGNTLYPSAHPLTNRVPALDSLHLWAPPPCIRIINSTLGCMGSSLTTLILKYPGPKFADLLTSTKSFDFPVLRWLEVRVLSSKKRSSLDCIVHALTRKPLPQLRHIHLETVSHLYTELKSSTILSLSRAAPSVRYFAMEGISVNKEILGHITRGWFRSLCSLELCGHAIGEMSRDLLMTIGELIESSSRLSKLTLSVDQVSDAVLRLILSDYRFSLITPRMESVAIGEDSGVDLLSSASDDENNQVLDIEEIRPTLGITRSLQMLLGGLLRVKRTNPIEYVTFNREMIDRSIALKIWLMNEYRRLEDVMVAAQCPCRGLTA